MRLRHLRVPKLGASEAARNKEPNTQQWDFPRPYVQIPIIIFLNSCMRLLLLLRNASRRSLSSSEGDRCFIAVVCDVHYLVSPIQS